MSCHHADAIQSRLLQLQAWMESREDEHLEFKEAKRGYDFETLVRYCVALANEGGGRMVLGVTDRPPRRVVGTSAFQQVDRTKNGLFERLRMRIEAEEIHHPDGRVLVFQVPSRPIGSPVHYQGAYWMRSGESLVPMTPEMLRRIFEEASPDFSAELSQRAHISDLDPAAIERFRSLWLRTSGNSALQHISTEQLLTDAELLVDGRLTYAALILFGTREALGRHLAQCEVIFEYRSSDASGPPQQRVEFRSAMLLVVDQCWTLIELRNDLQHFQHGMVMMPIPTFNEVACREAILNAISHRDYRDAGSVFVRQFPRRLEVLSPGGLPPGVTTENILWTQQPRNRRLAEALVRCGLVERAGQGMNRMFEECIKQSKLRIASITRGSSAVGLAGSRKAVARAARVGAEVPSRACHSGTASWSKGLTRPNGAG